MKKLCIVILLFSLAACAYAQTVKEEVDMIQAMYGMEKKAMIADFIVLEGTQKDAFWKVYDEYETKRKELGKKRIQLLKKYADNYSSLDDATTEEILKEMISLQGQTDKLIGTYATKLKKGAGVKAAGQFYQFEEYLLSKIRTEIFEEIPLIGEWDSK